MMFLTEPAMANCSQQLHDHQQSWCLDENHNLLVKYNIWKKKKPSQVDKNKLGEGDSQLKNNNTQVGSNGNVL